MCNVNPHVNVASTAKKQTKALIISSWPGNPSVWKKSDQWSFQLKKQNRGLNFTDQSISLWGLFQKVFRLVWEVSKCQKIW